MKCLACGGMGVPLGALGLRMWYRCRDCGMLFSRKMVRKARRVAVQTRITKQKEP